MRVLHVYKVYHPEDYTGVPKVIGTLTARLGGDVFALAPEAAELNWNNANIHLAKRDLNFRSTGLSLSGFNRFRELVGQADIVHYHYPWPYADLLHAYANPKIPAVCTYHSDIVKQKWLGRAYAPLRDWFLGQMRVIVATSPNYVATSTVLQKLKDKVQVVPLGIARDDYPAVDAERLSHWQQRLGQGFFLFLGALRYYKGLDTLLEAAAHTDLPVVIAGGGGEEARLKAKAAALNLTNVQFVGRVDEVDKIALLSLCQAFVFPSHLRSEAFGISLLEAAMMGKPMITCEIGTGSSYVNIAGETGLVVPPQNLIAFRNAMVQMRLHPDETSRMGAAARARFDAMFQADVMAASYQRIYESLILMRGYSI